MFSYSCRTTKSNKFRVDDNDPILYQIQNDSIFKNSFMGFVLYDVNNSKTKLDFNGDKLFTPASNTKIFTFYTALNILGDSIPVISYNTRGDTLYLRGTGNPLFANYDYSNDYSQVYDLINEFDKIIITENNFHDEKYGSGWAWDDYIYEYQLEKSGLPMFGNKLQVTYFSDTIFVEPEFLRSNIEFVEDSFYIEKKISSNQFIIGKFPEGEPVVLPVNIDNKLMFDGLKSVTGKGINFTDCGSSSENWLHINEPINDSMYLKLLHISDNFIAEQLISMCSAKIFHDTINSGMTLAWAQSNLMPYLDGNCRWVDGSGLSRYNLFKPESIVETLIKIRNKIGDEKIKYFFPEIPMSDIPDPDKNYGIYAKSGSLSNNYNLSGYIYTRKGNTYIFSFMNNHYLVKTSDLKREMKKILGYILENE